MGVSFISKRETTQTMVKALKCILSVSKEVPNLIQRGCRLRSSHHLKSA